MISPHGGTLINGVLPQEEKANILARVKDFKTLVLDSEKVKEVKNIANGVFSPLKGFLRQNDFQGVVSSMRLSCGTVWPIPIVLDITKEQYNALKDEKALILTDGKKPIALLDGLEIYGYDKDFLAQNVYGTLDRNHPGVDEVYKMGQYLVGGEIKTLDNEKDIFPEYNLRPEETRAIFQEKGWQKIVAFQTRNVPHCGHEFLQKFALKEMDGLLVHPVIGQKKLADFKDEFILASYQLLIDKYYPKDKVLLSILPFRMRYAGPREAVFHALVRKNFGCSHFIVGRDHAGVGNYYGPYDAQKIFDNFKKEEIGIEILKYENVIWCNACQNHVFENGCSHGPENKISFSGSRLRQYVQDKEIPPPYLLRPEVYQLLLQSQNPLTDNMYDNQKNNQKGFVLWLTGLSQAGKTTLADKLYEILGGQGLRVERLDGDVVRQSLTRDLGFSMEDRDENIRRIGFVAKLLSKNGVAVIASFISPYRSHREGVRKEVENFIEVFCKCPLEVCEQRDQKGLYQKARKGELQNFTGISDPYEEPENPEIIVETDKENVEQCAEKIINWLKQTGYYG